MIPNWAWVFVDNTYIKKNNTGHLGIIDKRQVSFVRGGQLPMLCKRSAFVAALIKAEQLQQIGEQKGETKWKAFALYQGEAVPFQKRLA